MMRRRLPSVLCALATIAVQMPVASAQGPQFQFRVRDRVLPGERPGLVLTPLQSVRKVRLTLRPGGGKAQIFTAGPIQGGRDHEVTWRQKAGTVHYAATLTAEDEAGHESTSQFEFDVVVGKGLLVRVDKSLDDIGSSKVSFDADFPVDKVELVVRGTGGKVLRERTQAFGGAPPGSQVTASWEPVSEDIVTITMKVFDPAGFWTGVELTPFWVDIPHEEVEFENGRWEIRPAEAPKLERTLERIQEELAKHGKDLVLRLFVAGYTDTVGTEADNQLLSERRARSIAGWFRRHGLSIEIRYQGFGENALYVATPDNTPEPRNRRALYVLGNAAPLRSEAMPRGDWRLLD